jgi:ubiquinone biosynthesis protein COQ4
MKHNSIKLHLKDLIENFTPINSNKDRISKVLECSIQGLNDPDNGNHFSHLTDLTSLNTLRWIKLKMEDSEEGKRILTLKPRINEKIINFDVLKEYKTNTLGYHYYKYMTSNMFTPDERPIAKYLPDLDLAYVCQRFKETHDFYHVLLDYGRSVPHEIAVKWFEALHLRLPSSSLAGMFGCLKFSPGELLILYTKHLPHIILNAEKSKFVMSYFYEERLDQNIDDLRNEMNIVPLNKF